MFLLQSNPMVFIGFAKKLNADLFSKIILTKEELFLLNGKEVAYCELCGIAVDVSPNTIKICDFYGQIEIYKNKELEPVGKGPFIYIVKLFSRKGKVYGKCKEIRKTTIYEEMAHHIEIKSLLTALCY